MFYTYSFIKIKGIKMMTDIDKILSEIFSEIIYRYMLRCKLVKDYHRNHFSFSIGLIFLKTLEYGMDV